MPFNALLDNHRTQDRAKILVVDDTPINILICHQALHTHYDLLMAKSGQECLEIAQKHGPDLILIDVLMPGMDGFDALTSLQKDPNTANIPVILLTSLTDVASQIRAFDSGAVDFLAQPVNPQLLLHRVANILERETLRQQAIERKAELRATLTDLNTQKLALDEHSLVSITDVTGKIIYVNDKFCATSGYSSNELIGNTHQMLKSGLHEDAYYVDLWETISNAKVWKGTLANRKKNGDIYWVSSTIVPRLDENGVPIQYIAILTDITEQVNTRRMLEEARQRESELGFRIQQKLLFGEPPGDIPGLAISKFSEASRGMDGDFYTFTRLGHDIFEVITGDVMGKGVNAALIGAGVKSAYRHTLNELMALDPKRALPSTADIVNGIHRSLTPELISLDSFVTLSLTRIDLCAGTVSWVNAGHIPTLHITGKQGIINHLSSDNLPIGVLENETYVEHRAPIQPGDTFLSYSDGIAETFNPEGKIYGTESIETILRDSHKAGLPGSIVLNRLRCDLNQFSRSALGVDDRTAIVIQCTHHSPPDDWRHWNAPTSAYVDLPIALNQINTIRSTINHLTEGLLQSQRDAFLLATVEAATNVIKHVHTDLREPLMTLRLERDAAHIAVEIVYPGEAFQKPDLIAPDFSGNSDGGFGLFLIENSVDEVIYAAPYPGMASTRLVQHLSDYTI